MSDPKFVVVQHAQGAAGKFLCTLLMCSPKVAHFDSKVESQKTPEFCLKYNQTHFIKDISSWLIHEPKPHDAWNLHFISPLYPRGENLTVDEFMSLAHQYATPYFWKSVDQQKMICLNWHKPFLPEFFSQARSIAVIIDPASEKWFHRALWYKHYGITNGKIHQKSHDPEFNSGSVKKYYQQFKNPIYVDEHKIGFVRKHIINGEQKLVFSNPNNFDLANQLKVNLSEILDPNKIIQVITKIYEFLDLGAVNSGLVTAMHKQWRSCHDFKYT